MSSVDTITALLKLVGPSWDHPGAILKPTQLHIIRLMFNAEDEELTILLDAYSHEL